ncbi:Putative cell wall binding repeat-containing protein [Lachnospiraceae bacterium NE2001]|nr:Putative cell wall binding repeat-containing protein [Lachnospiraceae bacterium NE2001]
MQSKRTKSVWRIVAITLAIFLAFGMMNVPKFAGTVEAATDEAISYSISMGGDSSYNYPDYPDANHAATIKVTVTPKLQDGVMVKFANCEDTVKTNGLTWTVGKTVDSKDGSSSEVTLTGYSNGSGLTGSTYLYVYLYNSDKSYHYNPGRTDYVYTYKYVTVTNYKYKVTFNGKGGKTSVTNPDTGESENVDTYVANVEEGTRLSQYSYGSYDYGWRYFSWPGSDDDYEYVEDHYSKIKRFMGYTMQGDSSGKIYTSNDSYLTYKPDKFASAYEYIIFGNVTLDAVWSDYAMVYFYSDKAAYDAKDANHWSVFKNGFDGFRNANKPVGYFYKNELQDDTYYDTIEFDAVAKNEPLAIGGAYIESPITDTAKAFIGWRCVQDGKLYTASNIKEFVPTADKTAFIAEYGDGYTVKFKTGKEGYFEGGWDYKKDEYKKVSEESYYYHPDRYIYQVPSVYKNEGYDYYSVVGWNDGSKTYTREELYDYKVTKNVTFTAVWQKNVASTVILHSNYPKQWGYREDTSVNKVQVNSGSVSLYARSFSSPGGYTIASYHTSDGKTYETGTYYYPTSSKADLYADWVESKYYKIMMHSNYPSSWGKEQTTLEKNGSTGNYFYPSMDGETIRATGKEDYYISYWFYYNENGEKVEVSNRFKPTGNMDLYANWTTDLPHEHSWDQGTVLKEATYEEEGRLVRKCTHCSEEHIEGIAKLEKPAEPSYSSEWVNGKWYEADGSQTYAGVGSWKSDENGYWFEDSSGWYPVSTWQKIDGKWYYFLDNGYMDYSEYRDGCWLGADGAWVESYYGGKWCSDATGWWYTDAAGWYPVSQWVWIDGSQYYFNGSGYWEQ